MSERKNEGWTDLGRSFVLQRVKLTAQFSIVSSEFLDSPVNNGSEIAVERKTHVADIWAFSCLAFMISRLAMESKSSIVRCMAAKDADICPNRQ